MGKENKWTTIQILTRLLKRLKKEVLPELKKLSAGKRIEWLLNKNRANKQ